MRKFLCIHTKKPETGFAIGVRLGDWVYGVWLGYGKPIWWKPRFIDRGNAHYGIGFGWLFLCFRVQIIKYKKKG